MTVCDCESCPAIALTTWMVKLSTANVYDGKTTVLNLSDTVSLYTLFIDTNCLLFMNTTVYVILFLTLFRNKIPIIQTNYFGWMVS